MGQFALISTVDSMGPEFPSHCVMVFDSERDAILFAAKCIVEHDRNAEFVEDEGNWILGEDHFDSPTDFLDAWQESLHSVEYFHIMPVRSVEATT